VALTATVRYAATELVLHKRVLCAHLAALRTIRGRPGLAIEATENATVVIARQPAGQGQGQGLATVTARCKNAERVISRQLSF